MTKPINDGLFHRGHRYAAFTLAQRFEQNYMPVTESGCWIWLGAMNVYGYGKLSHGPRGKAANLMAHRVAWELANGPIPEGAQINHHCDVRACVNPHHLYPGSQKENIADCYQRARARWSGRTHCERGHLLAGNTYTLNKKNAKKVNRCKTCCSEDGRAAYRRRVGLK